MIVLNDVSDASIGFESADNAVTMIDSSSETPVPKAPKDEIAEAILDRVDRLREKSSLPKG
jgi:phosphopantothenoylcysteine decarboxylase/phosphopantothenate--cysteine ligase